MKSFEGRLAVITGGGTGMGRELAVQLAAEGCSVALCDVSEENATRTRELCEQRAPAGTRITTCLADVADPEAVAAFAAHVASAHETDHIHLLFNNAGIAGGGSFVLEDREIWERTFSICWNGVYETTRAFLPMLLAAPEGHLVNTSSVNGFWASLGPSTANTAYSAAKFAVKGFTEALVNDFRNNAPHLRASVVMPGHIGTSIVKNSGQVLGTSPKDQSDEQIESSREGLERVGLVEPGATPEELRAGLAALGELFHDAAPMTAESAATAILDGVRAERWRILVGHDAEVLDRLVREDPESAYEEEFMERLRAQTTWILGT